MNGNGELTATENVIFYVSYVVLTQFLRMKVILMYLATETATATATERWKSGISHISKDKLLRTGRIACHPTIHSGNSAWPSLRG